MSTHTAPLTSGAFNRGALIRAALARFPGQPSHRAPARQNQPTPDGKEPGPEPEWGLSAGQVTALVLAILAACEVLGSF